MSTYLSLVIPDLIDQSDWLSTVKVEGFDTLYSKGKVQRLRHKTIHQCLANLLKIQGSLPMASLLAMGEGLVKSEDWWLRADPVQIQADASAAYMLGNDHLSLNEEESTQLIEEINEFISQDGLSLVAKRTNQWYLRLRHAPNITTHDVRSTLRKNIYTYLPEGENQSYWRKLFTELQMLLHQSPVNQHRREQGLPTIDALWFWGDGQLPEKPQDTTWTSVSGDNLLMQGISHWLELPYEDVKHQGTQFISQLSPGKHLCFIDSLAHNRASHDQYQWSQDLLQLERNIISPAISAIKQKQLTQLDLYLPQHCHITLNKGQLGRWWKKVKPMHEHKA